jgi:hypothetical protein
MTVAVQKKEARTAVVGGYIYSRTLSVCGPG